MPTSDQMIRWIPNLRRYARVLTRDVVRADDLVQDTLTRAIERQELFRQRTRPDDLRAWLFTIMHNLFISDLRREAGGGLRDDDAETGQLPAPPTDPDLRKDLTSGFSRLALEHREVLMLVAVEGLSYADAAAALHVPIGTVMSRLSRARLRLAQLLAGEALPAAPHDLPPGGETMLRVVK